MPLPHQKPLTFTNCLSFCVFDFGLFNDLISLWVCLVFVTEFNIFVCFIILTSRNYNVSHLQVLNCTIALLLVCSYANWFWVGLEAFRAQVIHKDKPNVLKIIWCALISLYYVFLKDFVFIFFFFVCWSSILVIWILW